MAKRFFKKPKPQKRQFSTLKEEEEYISQIRKEARAKRKHWPKKICPLEKELQRIIDDLEQHNSPDVTATGSTRNDS